MSVYQIGQQVILPKVTSTANYGYGLETLIAITTNPPWTDVDRISSVRDILLELNRDFANDWVSYRIVQ